MAQRMSLAAADPAIAALANTQTPATAQRIPRHHFLLRADHTSAL